MNNCINCIVKKRFDTVAIYFFVVGRRKRERGKRGKREERERKRENIMSTKAI